MQTIGRAARNENGRVILYADSVSPSMQASIEQTLERRKKQEAYNDENGIIPTTIQKALPVMGQEVEGLLSNTVGKGTSGGKRMVGSRTGGRGGSRDIVKRFDLGVGTWNEYEDSILSNISQPIWAQTGAEALGVNQEIEESDRDDVLRLIERLQKEMRTAAARLEFERAAQIRDRILQLENEFYN